MNISYRPSQQKILQYTHGTMGIAAVPGAGKTFTLSALAAEIIGRGELAPEQEVLIVTLVNSAVDNFSSRINDPNDQTTIRVNWSDWLHQKKSMADEAHETQLIFQYVSPLKYLR